MIYNRDILDIIKPALGVSKSQKVGQRYTTVRGSNDAVRHVLRKKVFAPLLLTIYSLSLVFSSLRRETGILSSVIQQPSILIYLPRSICRSPTSLARSSLSAPAFVPPSVRPSGDRRQTDDRLSLARLRSFASPRMKRPLGITSREAAVGGSERKKEGGSPLIRSSLARSRALKKRGNVLQSPNARTYYMSKWWRRRPR